MTRDKPAMPDMPQFDINTAIAALECLRLMTPSVVISNVSTSPPLTPAQSTPPPLEPTLISNTTTSSIQRTTPPLAYFQQQLDSLPVLTTEVDWASRLAIGLPDTPARRSLLNSLSGLTQQIPKQRALLQLLMSPPLSDLLRPFPPPPDRP
jgi:hypothetical protein